MTMTMGEQAEFALKLVRDAEFLVFDVETSGLDWKRNFPVGYVIGSTTEDVVYVPVRHGGGGNLNGLAPPLEETSGYHTHPFEQELAKAFEARRGPVIGHNIKFDAHMAASVGIMLGRNLIDTQINAAMLDEYSRSFGLDAVAKQYNIPAKKAEQMYEYLSVKFGIPATREAMSHYWKLPGDDAMAQEYAIGDGVTTLSLFYQQMTEIRAQELDYIHDLESRLIWTLFRMERRGIAVDMEYLERTKEEVLQRIEDAKSRLPADFNTRSPLQMKALMESVGQTDWPLTAAGNPSFTEKWLKKFETGRDVITVRKWSNLINSFMGPLMETHVFEGRVHANINQLKSDDYGTVSGRLSCSAPNLQQIPKHDKEIAKLFRRAFVADPGYIFKERDYSQCEPRLFGHYSEEPAIIEGYNADPPRDMHQVTAGLLEVERDPTAKRMNMGILTGMYPKAFAGHMGWELDRATEAWNAWYRMYPSIKDFQDLAKQVINSRGFVKTILGRRCRLEKPKFAYRAVSKIIQGGNADILKFFMLKLDTMCENSGEADLLMTVHDAFEWQHKDTPAGRELSDAMDREMLRVQEPPFNLIVPFKIDKGEGANWAEATFGA